MDVSSSALLKQIRRKISPAANFEQLMRLVVKTGSRRLHVRALLARAKSCFTEEESASYIEQAADVLFSFLKKPRLARLLYRHAGVVALAELDDLNLPESLSPEEILVDLRARERFDAMEVLLRNMATQSPPDKRRPLLLELGYVLRFGRGNLSAAADCFEELVRNDPTDREAWGELLECLEDAGQTARLLPLLDKRIEVTTGLEQRELMRHRDSLFLPR